jgi:hypothetical protein
MQETKLWVGLLQGASVVFDPDLQLPESQCIALFQVLYSKIGLYARSYLRAVTKSMKPEHTNYEMAVQTYRTWRTSIDAVYLRKLHDNISAYDALFRRDIERTKMLHSRYLHDRGLGESQVTKPRRGAQRRASICHSCGKNVSTVYHLCCTKCGWFICYDCGACGCGWHPRDTT